MSAGAAQLITGTTAAVPGGSRLSMHSVTSGNPALSTVGYAYRGEF